MGIEDDQRDRTGRQTTRPPRARPGALESQRLAPAARSARERQERDIRDALRAGAGGAATDALRLYEAEVFGFLLGVLDNPAAARDVYASVTERVATEITRFGWRCALRTWLYAVAHQEIGRRLSHPPALAPDHFERTVTLPDPTTTVARRPTGMRAAVATLRRHLPAEDREILILRLDRHLSLTDLAITQLHEGASRAEIRRESIRLRDRLQQIREDLAQCAIDQKLLAPR